VTIATALSLVVLAAVVVVVVARLSAKHQFDGDLWKPFTEYSVLKFLFLGLVNTLKVAAVAMALALMFGGTLALGRLSLLRPVRWLTTGLIELFRAYPLLLLIFFMPKLLKLAGVELSSFWPLAIALMLYNGSILAEIFRAGVLSLDHGQEEAAQSIGLGYWQSMAFVLAPQAVRRMAPAIVSQLITLLKDTALGALIFYDELLRRADGAGNEFGNNLQMYVIVAAVYIVINFALSRLARRLEVRQRRRYGADAISVAGVEELAGA